MSGASLLDENAKQQLATRQLGKRKRCLIVARL
jgi:hypothetical protein